MRRVARHRTCGNFGSIANVSPPFEQMQMQKNFAPKLRTSEIVGMRGDEAATCDLLSLLESLERLCCMLHERIVTNSSRCIWRVGPYVVPNDISFQESNGDAGRQMVPV